MGGWGIKMLTGTQNLEGPTNHTNIVSSLDRESEM